MADRRSFWRLAALSLVMLLPSLGTSIANVVLPTVSVSFAVPQQDAQWVVIAYLLSVTSLIVSAGRLGDIWGRRRLLLAGIATFAVASAGCAVAPSLGVLIAARAMQGLGAAVMMALTVASVADLVPKERTGSAMGLLGTVSAIGTALGPSLGGALLSGFGWPSVFAVMSGTALPAFALALLVLPAETSAASTTPSRFDLPGTLLLALALAAYALATTLNATHVGLANAALGLAALVLLGAFWVVESRSKSPLIDLSLLRDPRLGSGLASLALVSAIVMATLVVGPFYLSHVLRLSPLATGLVMSVGPILAAVAGFPAGRLVDRAGARPVMIWGLGGVGAGSLLMTLLPAHFGTAGYVTSLAVITTGYALFQAANNTAVMIDVARDRRGVVSGALSLSRNLGLITGASAMGAVFAMGQAGSLLPGLNPAGGVGLEATFALATAFAGVALAMILLAGPGDKRRAGT